MNIGSLFSGIGLLELGLEWAGVGTTRWQVENDPEPRSVLETWWPQADRSVTDVREAGRGNLSRVDLVCGGFPCQDVSSAGLRKGLALGERSGLWSEFRRIVGELEPRWVVVENVASGASRWLPHVRHDLRALGYRSTAVALSAADVGAPHKRGRIFVVAYSDRRGPQGEREPLQGRADGGQPRHDVDGCASAQGLADAHGSALRLEQQRIAGGWSRAVCDSRQAEFGHVGSSSGEGRESRLGGGAHGGADGLDRWPRRWGQEPEEWEPPRTLEKQPRGTNRRARLRALGNAVVPQCARAVGRSIADGSIVEVMV